MWLDHHATSEANKQEIVCEMKKRPKTKILANNKEKRRELKFN